MKLLYTFIIICITYEASAGSSSYPTTQAITSPLTQPLCVDCQDFWRNGIQLPISNTCDPAGKTVCTVEVEYSIDEGFEIGYCAGRVTDPYSNADKSSNIVEAMIACQ